MHQFTFRSLAWDRCAWRRSSSHHPTKMQRFLHRVGGCINAFFSYHVQPCRRLNGKDSAASAASTVPLAEPQQGPLQLLLMPPLPVQRAECLLEWISTQNESGAAGSSHGAHCFTSLCWSFLLLPFLFPDRSGMVSSPFVGIRTFEPAGFQSKFSCMPRARSHPHGWRFYPCLPSITISIAFWPCLQWLIPSSCLWRYFLCT